MERWINTRNVVLLLLGLTIIGGSVLLRSPSQAKSQELRNSFSDSAKDSEEGRSQPGGTGRITALPSSDSGPQKKSTSTRPGATSAAKEFFTLGGRVVDESGNPVTSATVRAAPAGGEAGRMVRTTSGPDGAFELSRLAGKTYNLQAYHQDYEQGSLDGIASNRHDVVLTLKKKPVITFTGFVVDERTSQSISDYTVQVRGRGSRNPRIEPGKFTVNFHIGDRVSFLIEAPDHGPLATSTIYITSGAMELKQTFRLSSAGKATGKVVDADTSEPVAGVQVKLEVPHIYKTTSGTITGSDGKFQLSGLATGSNMLLLIPPAPYSELRKPCSIAYGADNDLGVIAVSRSAAHIRGKVVEGEQNTPVTGTEVTLNNMNNAPLGQMITDAGGEFEFPSLANGRYLVRVRQHGVVQQVTLNPQDKRTVIIRVGKGGLAGRVTEDGKPVKATIHFSQGGTGFMREHIVRTDDGGNYQIKGLPGGRWRAALNSSTRGELEEYVNVPENKIETHDFLMPSGSIVGTVTDDQGKPVAGAQIQVNTNPGTGAFERYKPPQSVYAQSGSNGAFILKRIPPGSYTVRATKTSLGSAEVSGVQVAASGPSAPVTVKLRRGDTGTLISSAYSMSTGLPLKEAWCYLSDESGRFAHGSTRDDNGIMTIRNLPAGQYQVSVGADNYSEEIKTVTVTAGQTAQIDSVLYEGGTLRLGIAGTDGSFLPGVPVQLRPDDPNSVDQQRQGQTSAGGMWVVKGLVPGDYTLTATPPGGQLLTQTVRIQTAQNTDILLVSE